MDLSKLTLVTSMQLTTEMWEGKVNQLKRLEPGDKIVLGDKTMTIIGEKDGRIEVDHPRLGKATVDPMMVSTVILS